MLFLGYYKSLEVQPYKKMLETILTEFTELSQKVCTDLDKMT